MNNSIKNIIDKCKGNFNIERLNQYIDAFNNKKRGEYIFVTCIDIQLHCDDGNKDDDYLLGQIMKKV